MAQPPLTVYRGFVWSPFVTKLETRLRFGGLAYKTEQGVDMLGLADTLSQKSLCRNKRRLVFASAVFPVIDLGHIDRNLSVFHCNRLQPSTDDLHSQQLGEEVKVLFNLVQPIRLL